MCHLVDGIEDVQNGSEPLHLEVPLLLSVPSALLMQY